MSMVSNRKPGVDTLKSPVELVRLDTVEMDEDDEILPDFEAEVDGRRVWALVTSWGSGLVDHASVPKSPRPFSDCRSATLTWTTCTDWGRKKRPWATPVTTSARMTAAAARTPTTGRDVGSKIGSLMPNLGWADGAERTRLYAEATSTLRSGTASTPATAFASSANTA